MNANSQFTSTTSLRPGQWVRTYLTSLFSEKYRYWIFVPITGLLSGLLSVGLTKVLHAVEVLTWGSSNEILESTMKAGTSSPWRVITTLALGGLLAAIALRFLKRSGDLQGTPAIIEALAFKKGRLSVLRTLLESLVSITCVGTGASLGREGALIQAGASAGSFLGSRLKLDDYHVRILLACGAAGGMAASYNVPLGASVFAMEILLGSFALELIVPIIISSFVSTTVSRAMLGGLPAYSIQEHYKFVTEWEILLIVVLGVLMGLISVLFIRVFSGIGALFAWFKRGEKVKPILAMTLLGCAGLYFPHLFGNGYHTVNATLRLKNEISLPLLLLLPVLKIIFTAICRGSGVPGGLFTPSLFVGALLVSAFGVGANAVFPEHSIAVPAAYALVGMGAIVAGTLQAPITAILMIFEMTRDYEVIVPLMSACAASTIVSHLLQESSLFTEPLRQRGIRLPRVYAPTWMHQPKVGSALQSQVATISPAARFQEVVDNFLMAPEGQDQIYMTNKEGVYLGSISLHEIKQFFRETEHLDSVIAADIANHNSPFVYADDPLLKAIELLAQSHTEHVPVLDAPTTRRLAGTVSKRGLLAVYSAANIAQRTNAQDSG